jgi:hypothetical protein
LDRSKLYAFGFIACVAIATILLVLYGDVAVFILLSSFEMMFFIVRMVVAKDTNKDKIFFSFAYFSLAIVFMTILITIRYFVGINLYVRRSIGVMLMLLPFIAEYIYRIFWHPIKRFPSIENVSALSFEALLLLFEKMQRTGQGLVTIKRALSKSNLDEIMYDLPRHSVVSYVNKGTLTEEYFVECEKALSDPNLYLVISNSGSAASQLISVFTKKLYNHVSISFDRELKTILSYNGGERAFPPGLNKEQLAYFAKHKNASILVYRLAVSRQKKEMLIAKIRGINITGSAYNLIGLVTKRSIRPNIMFCSQFVYSMLESIDENVYEGSASYARPTDFIEKDYYRKLEFCTEIRFS